VAVDQTLIPGTDAPFSPAFVNVHSGTFAGFATVRCNAFGCTPAELITLSQMVSVTPNTTYSLGFFLGNDSSSGLGIAMGPEALDILVDGVGLLTGFENFPFGSSPSDMQLFSSSFFTGTRSTITATFQINGSGTSHAGLSFDDFFVTPVPEPGTFGLIAAALFTLYLRHRFSPDLTRGRGLSRS
jgi:hypothetical protein